MRHGLFGDIEVLQVEVKLWRTNRTNRFGRCSKLKGASTRRARNEGDGNSIRSRGVGRRGLDRCPIREGVALSRDALNGRWTRLSVLESGVWLCLSGLLVIVVGVLNETRVRVVNHRPRGRLVMTLLLCLFNSLLVRVWTVEDIRSNSDLLLGFRHIDGNALASTIPEEEAEDETQYKDTADNSACYRTCTDTTLALARVVRG
jgi:hypothetical protein